MTVFHFAFDLELFGFQEPGFTAQPHWKYFARAIASSFLFLTGFSLFLAHSETINWSGWKSRMVKIVAAAMLITIATYFATPQQFIFFGILHAIAFASLAGLAFLQLPILAIVICAIGIFLIGQGFETTLLDHWVFWWTGLSVTQINSSDYVPVFPWLSAPLLGVAAAKYASQHSVLEKLASFKFASTPMRLMRFLGHNSLIYYLLHQPVMIALLFASAYLLGKI